MLSVLYSLFSHPILSSSLLCICQIRALIFIYYPLSLSILLSLFFYFFLSLFPFLAISLYLYISPSPSLFPSLTTPSLFLSPYLFPSLATSSLSLSLLFPVKYSPTYRRCFISFSSLLFSPLLSSSLIIHPINILSHVTLIFCMKNVISRVEMLQKQQTISIDRFRQQTDDLKVTVGRDLDEASVDSAGTY